MRHLIWGRLKTISVIVAFMKEKWKTMLLLLALCGSVAGVLFFLVDWIPRRDLTLRTINNTSKAVAKFYQAHKSLPASLSEIQMNGNPKDDWGNQIIYTRTGSHTYGLRSYGEDGKQGDDDIQRTFQLGP